LLSLRLKRLLIPPLGWEWRDHTHPADKWETVATNIDAVDFAFFEQVNAPEFSVSRFQLSAMRVSA
jgi:hypothetical protein